VCLVMLLVNLISVCLSAARNIVYVVSLIFLLSSFVVSASASDCLERLVSEMG